MQNKICGICKHFEARDYDTDYGLCRTHHNKSMLVKNNDKSCKKFVDNSPRWIKRSDNMYECSKCGWLLITPDCNPFKYCPNCGFKIIEVNDETK